MIYDFYDFNSYVSSDGLHEGIERDVVLTTQLADQTSRGIC